jgi:hypothetical protein
MSTNISEAARSAMNPGESNWRATIGKTGPKRLNNWLAAGMGHYHLVLLTDQRMAVYKVKSPKSTTVGSLVWEGPLATIPHGNGATSRVQIGPCSLWVGREIYPYLDDPASGVPSAS